MKLLSLLFLVISCSSIGPEANVSQKIKEQHWAGEWVHNDSTMTIWCNGSFQLDDAQSFTNPLGSGKSKGGFIKRWNADSFDTGPLFGMSFKINKFPYPEKKFKHSDKDTWWVVIDDETWELDKSFTCP